MKKVRKRLLFIALFLVLITGALLALGKTNPTPTAQSGLIGRSVTSLQLTTYNGAALTGPWTQHHGGALVFFASWCPDCHFELPALGAVLRSDPVLAKNVIGVDADVVASSGKSFVHSAQFPAPIAFDSSNHFAESVFGFAGLPDTVFFNAAGRIVSVRQGIEPPGPFRAELSSL